MDGGWLVDIVIDGDTVGDTDGVVDGSTQLAKTTSRPWTVASWALATCVGEPQSNSTVAVVALLSSRHVTDTLVVVGYALYTTSTSQSVAAVYGAVQSTMTATVWPQLAMAATDEMYSSVALPDREQLSDMWPPQLHVTVTIVSVQLPDSTPPLRVAHVFKLPLLNAMPSPVLTRLEASDGERDGAAHRERTTKHDEKTIQTRFVDRHDGNDRHDRMHDQLKG